MDLGALWADAQLRRDVIATLILVAVLIAARVATLRAIRSLTVSAREVLRLRWVGYVKRSAWVLLVLGVVVIWSAELQAFALSIVAFAVAIVIATKELILCASGSLLRTAAGTFTIGDRIEVAGVRGDVVDHGLLTTTILETGPTHQRTGRTVVVPNAVFLTQQVVNETSTDDYVLHTIRVPLARSADWRTAEQTLLALAGEACADHVKPAGDHMQAVSSLHGLMSGTVEPRVSLVLEQDDAMTLIVRVPVPARDKGTVEQAILRGFLGAGDGD